MNVNTNGYRLMLIPSTRLIVESGAQAPARDRAVKTPSGQEYIISGPGGLGKADFVKSILNALDSTQLAQLPASMFEKTWIRLDQQTPKGARELAVYSVGSKKPVRLSKEISRRGLRKAFALLVARDGFIPWPENDGTLKTHAAFARVSAED